MAQITLFAPLAGDPITLTTALAPSALPLGVQLREASPEDEAEIGRLYFDAHPAGTAGADVEAATTDVRKTFEGGHGELLGGGCRVAVDEQGAIICCVLTVASAPWPDVAGEAFVIDLFTAPPWRGRGLARAVMIAVMRAAATQGRERLGLRVEDGNEAAVRLYRHLGFSEGGAGDGEHAPTQWAVATARAVAESSAPPDAAEVVAAAGGEIDPAVLAAVTGGASPASPEDPREGDTQGEDTGADPGGATGPSRPEGG